MTTGSREAHQHFSSIASHLGGLLNRVVFHGIESCREQFDSTDAVRAPQGTGRAFFAISTTPLDRLGPELTTAGWARVARTRTGERWAIADGLSLSVEAVPTDLSGADDVAVLEYASLLTRSIILDAGTTIRVTALPAQLPLIWRSHARSGLTFSASTWVEDVIEIVVRRSSIRADIVALPEELRTMVARAAGQFAESEAALWTIERALPDARATPGLATKTLARFRDLAALAAA